MIYNKKYVFGLPVSGTEFLKSFIESYKGVFCYVNGDFWQAPKNGDWLPEEPTV